MARRTDDTGTAILRAASDLLAAEGPGALSVRRIAAAAGCSTMGLYSRFGGKDGVVDELFAEGFEHLCAAMQGLPTTASSLADFRGTAVQGGERASERRKGGSLRHGPSVEGGTIVPVVGSNRFAFQCLTNSGGRVHRIKARQARENKAGSGNSREAHKNQSGAYTMHSIALRCKMGAPFMKSAHLCPVPTQLYGAEVEWVKPRVLMPWAGMCD